MNEQEAKEFLDNFPDEKRGLITQQFCFAVRAGCQSISDILTWVSTNAFERYEDQYSDDVTKESQRILMDVIGSQGAKDFANFIWWRESLPKEDRLKMKYAKNKQHALKHMEGKPPSEKQLKYLRGLGCEKIPATMAEASQLIEQYK